MGKVGKNKNHVQLVGLGFREWPFQVPVKAGSLARVNVKYMSWCISPSCILFCKFMLLSPQMVVDQNPASLNLRQTNQVILDVIYDPPLGFANIFSLKTGYTQ